MMRVFTVVFLCLSWALATAAGDSVKVAEGKRVVFNYTLRLEPLPTRTPISGS